MEKNNILEKFPHLEQLNDPFMENRYKEPAEMRKSLEKIIEALDEVHTLLSKSSLSSETYQPISLLLAASKSSLREFHVNIISLQDGVDVGQEMYSESRADIERLNTVIEIKEVERRQWAEMCIRKQRQIEGLNDACAMQDEEIGRLKETIEKLKSAKS